METPNAWEIYASSKQLSRNNWRSVAASLGRQLSTTPEHLSRVFPQYFEAIGDAPIGSSKYAVCLGLMKRPKGDGTDHVPVAYIVNFTAGDKDKVVGTVEYRVQPDSTVTENAEVELTIGNADEEACSIKANSDSAQPVDPVAVSVSYPIPPSETKVGTVKHPYFHFQMPFESKMAQFEWQTHPVEHGPLRYTLVRMPGEEATDESSTEPEVDVHAIYHHIGLGVSMNVSHSEGVLLLPPCTDPKSEAMIVASVLGMLRRVRGLDGEKGNKEVKHRRFGWPARPAPSSSSLSNPHNSHSGHLQPHHQFSSFEFYDSNPAFCSPNFVFPDTNLDLASFAPDPSLSLYDADPSAFLPLPPDLAGFSDLDYASVPTGTSSSPYAPDSIDLTAISTPVDVNDSLPFLDIDSSGTDSDTQINQGQLPLLMPASRPPPVSITASTSKDNPPKETPNRVSKRQLNTLAARRYRQRRVDRMNELEAELEKVKRERDELKMRVSKLEGETDALRGLLKNKDK
ncbi:hypothetical protein CNMCM7691_009416 [Aspergillus felis]|uniref:BZIP domain-containing protein n=1 Tax=Aspergillus felis TaxID=1287682 RepID=A0A8H6QVU2_9EURO|nr:hypothetical protein CNMCM7691_009416 [Aspergillus felis]